MTKSDLIKKFQEKAEIASRAEAERLFNCALDCIYETLCAAEEITLRGFGSFKIIYKGERPGRHPKTGEPMTLPPLKLIRFLPAKAIKESINKDLS